MDFNKLGFFAVTCSKESLESMIVEVDRENEMWRAMELRRKRYTSLVRYSASIFHSRRECRWLIAQLVCR